MPPVWKLSRCVMLFFCCFVLAAMGGCGEQEQAKKVDLSERREITLSGAPAALTYAYLPQYTHTASYQRHHLIVEYLARVTGLDVQQIFPDTFDEHVHMVGRGLIDISFVNPFIYVKLADLHGARPLVRIVEPTGQLNFRGQVICRADNPEIKTIQDLRGKRLIAVDPSSAGGYLFPWGLILENGLRPQDFAAISFAPGPGGKQEKVVMAVYSGKYDVGTIREGTLNLVADKIDLKQIRVLAESRYYPGWMYAARRDLDPALASQVQKALLDLDYDNPEHRKMLDNAGFIGAKKAVDADFDPVRHLMKMVQAHPGSPKTFGSSPGGEIKTWSD